MYLWPFNFTFLKLDHLILNTAFKWTSLGQFQWIVAASCVKRLGYMVWNPSNEYNKIESCTIQAFWGSTGLFLSVSLHTHVTFLEAWSIGISSRHLPSRSFTTNENRTPTRPRSVFANNDMRVNLQFVNELIQVLFVCGCLHGWILYNWAKTHVFKSYHHIIISRMLCHSQPLGWIVLTMGGNSVSLWGWLLEAMEENFSKNKQSSLNALMVLKSIVTTFAWNSKKTPACHGAPVFEGFWHPLL